ncbi:MAG: hypothetical protein K2P41_10330 [Lachnospiraceae bacterium]|nr:hypothetical protein [Lachnospiraceae bacterium]
MSAETRAYVIGLLESYHKRMNQIALLHYELEHPANVSPDEMIGAMSLGHGDGSAHSKGHISNKTLYIALNYQQQTERVNSETRSEIVDRLIELEQEQERLVYYIALLKNEQQETVIHRFYFEGRTWSEIAQELHVVTRTIHKIKNRALDRLAGMYTFTENSQS